MKILAIRGENLASLENTFEIDFTKEPLKSAGIFAITGQTGAGKSTLLDALCLALFDDAPRLNKAENVSIVDVSDKTIGQKDSRTILRRGASEGYAEVDFIALNGDKYRSRWSVRRARGKSDGSIQKTNLEVHNLTTNQEEQGTKNVLLGRISELIGLNFQQFTRAVLLAQGDFATFLKADSKEKAELLEKLTGTEIYSEASRIIFAKASDAKNEYFLLKQRIQDIVLLSDDEIIHIEKESKTLEEQFSPLKKQLNNTNKKLAWIKTNEELRQELKQAEEDKKQTEDKIVANKDKIEFIEKYDYSEQAIAWYNDSIIKKTKEKELIEKEKEKSQILSEIQEKLAKLEKELEDIQISKTKHEEEYEKLKPTIEEAKKIDIILRPQYEALELQKTEINTLKGEQENAIKLKKELDENIENIGAKKAKINTWFTDNDLYSSIIPNASLIINQIKLYNSTLKNIEGCLKNETIAIKDKEDLNKDLAELNEESERLNKLLPSEILELRKNLTDGIPCPVCGSEHHPLQSNTSHSTINQEDLEIKKKTIAEKIEEKNKRIEGKNNQLIEIRQDLKNSEQKIKETFEDLQANISQLPNWENAIKSEDFITEIQNVSTSWQNNKLLLEKINIDEKECSTSLNHTSSVLAELEKKLQIIETDHKSKAKDYEARLEERRNLLGGKKVTDIENQFSTILKDLLTKLENKRNEKDKLSNKKSSILGEITQIKNEITTAAKEISNLEDSIKAWIDNNQKNITSELLILFHSKSKEWIKQEKSLIENLNKSLLVAQTTIKERQEKFNKHQASEDIPLENESHEFLMHLVEELEEKSESLTKRKNEIDVQLMNHQKNKELIKSFEQELLQRQEKYDNWAKLNDLLGSASGDKFKKIAQGYTLDILLSYANIHLQELTKRYKLEKIPDTLALQVIDNDSLGEVRSVHSLSGGESFLVSLALALGLSSLSSNQMKIESLFIDEGFGSLDVDTLSITMDALDNLQMQGRKIGVISHVEEMKERISTQIQVTKLSNGKSQVNVVG